MKLSFTYYLTLIVIKLKGLKKDFSKAPIDYKKIRKEDVHYPKEKFYKSDLVKSFKISNTLITEVKQEKFSSDLLIFVHGGAFISGPSKIHWDTLKTIYKQSQFNIWMCDYPKAPENQIQTLSDNIDSVYTKALEKYEAKNITLIGDSVGGNLITTLIQRLVQKGMDLPKQIILVSPVMDSSISNPDIDQIDKIDPMLGKSGVLSSKKLCAKELNLKDPIISPLYGSFSQFPPTLLVIAENDITYPDQLLAIEKMKEANINIEVIEGKKMPHIWPFLPVMKEAKITLAQIIKKLNS